jgi:hypothetical protein
MTYGNEETENKTSSIITITCPRSVFLVCARREKNDKCMVLLEMKSSPENTPFPSRPVACSPEPSCRTQQAEK